MNTRLYTALLMLICLCGAPYWAISQEQANFRLSGVIVDSLSGDPLVGASIYEAERYAGTSTDLDGRWALPNLNGTRIALVFSYLGYESKTLTFSLPRAEEEFLVIELTPQAARLEQVTVVSSLEGQQRALNQQRSADNIVNIISADLIGKFPDLNVAEALQRVSGINIQRDKGEGSTVSIRGTPAHFTSISINGEQMPSVQQSGSRNESLDLIPADQLASLEITKSITPDMDGDAIGGNINLRTPTARRLDFQLKAEAGMGFNDLAGDVNGTGRLRLSKRFMADERNKKGRLGVMLSGSYFRTNNSEDRTDARWSGLPRPIERLDQDTIVMQDYQYRKTENVRTRIGATATVDYKVKNHEVVFNYMLNRRTDNDVRNRLRYDFDRSGTRWIAVDSVLEGRTRRDINIWDEDKNNQSFNLQGFHLLGQWSVDWAAFYTLSDRSFSSIRGDFARDGITLVADNPTGMNDQVPLWRPARELGSVNNPLLIDDFRRYEEDMERSEATNLVAKIDLKRDFLINNFPSFFKMGAKIRQQTNSKFRDNRVLAWFDPNNTLDLSEAFARVIADTEPIHFLNGRYRLGPRIDPERFADYIAANRRLLTASDDAWDSERLSKSDTYDAFEDIYSAYAMARVQANNLMILAGFRYEYNDVRYDAFDVFRSGTNVIADPIQGGSDYGFLLPNVQLKYSLDRLTHFRFAYTQSYARPNFTDIVPFVNYDVDAITLFIGNPDLAPSLANNIDLMFEKYLGNVGIISAGLFFKHLDRFQFSRIVPVLQEDFPGFPQTAGFQFRQEQNGESATVYGLELNFMSSLDFLPGLFKGLSLLLNYTLTESDAFTQDRTGISLPGQARHTGNASLTYDYKGFTSKVSLNYNGAFVNAVASDAQDDIIQADRLQLDFNCSQRIGKKSRIYAEFINITNAPTIRYQGIPERISRIAYFGWIARMGVSFRL